jgi:hypothetical protein
MFPISITFTINSADELAKLESVFTPGTTAPKSAAAPAAASGKATVKESAAPSKTADESTPAVQTAAAQPQASTAAEGNAAAAPSAQEATAASAASSAEPEVDFDTLKKAFLALSTKDGGRAKCEGVLKPHGLAKLSEAKPEQYGALLTAIHQASA